MEIKDILKNTRAAMGLSQSKFAKQFEIPTRTYQEWEQGHRTPLPYVFTLLMRLIALEGWKVLFTVNYKDDPCADISLRDTTGFKCIKQYTTDPMKTPFSGGTIDSERIEAFLKSRCPDPSRKDLKELLSSYGLPSLEPLSWCRKTHGVLYDDFFWIRFPNEKITWDDVRVR